MYRTREITQAVQAVWERGHREYHRWPAGKREAAHPAASALLRWLRSCHDEAALERCYWQVGQPQGALLRRLLPAGFNADEQLTLEDACFWRRLLELRCDDPVD